VQLRSLAPSQVELTDRFHLRAGMTSDEGAVTLIRVGTRRSETLVVSPSDRAGGLGEHGRDGPVVGRAVTEFVVTATALLHWRTGVVAARVPG